MDVNYHKCNTFLGWQANLSKDVPFAVIKLSLYEGCVRVYERTFGPAHTTGHSVCGVASGVITAVITQPLDVVNTVMKSSVTSNDTSMSRVLMELLRRDGPLALLRGLAPRAVILGAGSGVFWGSYSGVASLLDGHHK